MLKRTHLAIATAVALYFLPFVTNKFLFVPTVLVASLIPTLSMSGSNFEESFLYKPFKWIFSNEGLISSYTLCIALTLLFVAFYPVLALPFFLGYSFTLATNSFTKEGIQPFWPLKMHSKGMVESEGKIDYGIFVAFLLLDVVLIAVYFII